MMWLASLLVAQAQEVQVNADVKSFFIAGFPFEHLLMVEDDYGLAFLDTRLKRSSCGAADARSNTRRIREIHRQ